MFSLEYAKYAEARFGTSYKTYYWYYGDPGYDACEKGNGRGCAAAVMEHGWKIKYYDNKARH